ncbi:MAG: hypothetical protein FGM24_07525 [Candidatus Kapabacteria bacterium]|nr:hypothetical protein [Candidatus Kapabacteria bacterium]
MRPDRQHDFISRVTPESYQGFKADLHAWLGMSIEYRVCEMPIFVSDTFRRQLEDAAIGILRQCVQPDVMAVTASTLTPEITVPRESPCPLFAVVDFAVTKDADGTFRPRLIELQGFPSLYGYQYLYASHMQSRYGLDDTTPFFGGLDTARYIDVMRTALLGNHDPAECALLEVDPQHQKTRPDFIATEKLFGLRTVDIRDVRVRNGRLYDGSGIRLRRVFNRAIVDELTDRGITLDLRWNDDVDVEWAGHPNWYFRISKFIMPYLRHQAVPTTQFLDTIDAVPDDLSDYVLKPLYAFAGKGVNVHPTHADIAAVPAKERHAWILQQKVRYADCVETPFGMNRVEIRVMTVWPDDVEAPIPVMSLARTGRGDLMGARYNTDPWTGSSGCLFDLP